MGRTSNSLRLYWLIFILWTWKYLIQIMLVFWIAMVVAMIWVQVTE